MKKKNIKEALLMLLGSMAVTFAFIAVTWIIGEFLFGGVDSSESRFFLTLPTMGTVFSATLLVPFAILNLIWQLLKAFFSKPPKKL